MSRSALRIVHRRHLSFVPAIDTLRGGSLESVAAAVEQLSDHDRIGMAANAHDLVASETDDPTIMFVEPRTVLGRHQGVKPDQRLIILDDEMLHMKLCALWKHLSQLGERSSNEGRLASVLACEWMGAHYGPIDIVGDMREERGAVAVFQTLEDLASVVGCDGHRILMGTW